MTSPLREAARALDDAALEVLASKGLVRRAAADVAAGRATLANEDEHGADVSIDGETVQVRSDGPRLGVCSCPATGVCRHRLAAAILLRDCGAEAGPPQSAPVDPTEWKAVMAALTLDDLAGFAGRGGWREAREAVDRAPDAEVSPLGASLQVRLDPRAEPVLFMADGGLEAALTKSPDRKRKVHIVTAALAARRAFGLPAVADEATSSESGTTAPEPDAGTLERVREALRRAYGTALAFAPAALEAELGRLALTGRVEAMPRLAASLRRLAGGFEPLRRRAADADPETMLELLAEAYALATALASRPGGSERSVLIGQVRADYEPIGDLALFGLGARLWTTPAGAHGVSVYFHGAGSEGPFTLTQARPDHSDGSFDPRTAFHRSPVWGSPMARLSAAEVRLTGALASASRRLSTSQGTSAEVRDWVPRAEGVRDWDCVYSDWRELERRLQIVLAGRLAAPAAIETPVVLVFARYAPVRFDELTQTLTWPLADRGGRWIGLTLPFEGVERDRVAVLERLTARERFWAVLATAEMAAGGIELRPYALWAAGQHLLDFSVPPDARSKPVDDFAALLARLRAGAGATRNGPQMFAERRTHSDRLVDKAWSLLLRGAESGRVVTHDALARECGELAGEFTLAGLSALARPFDAIAKADEPEDACLRAVWAIVSARRLRARLAWMA